MFTDDNDVVTGVLLADEMDFLCGKFIQAFDEEDLRPFITVDPQGGLHVEAGFLDCL